MRTAIIALLGVSLAACSSAPQSNLRRQIIDRALAGAPGQAQPSTVVAAELAFARMAREEGQWTAFAKFAASGALLHGRDGPVDAKQWLAARANPAVSVQWSPRAVWMSCDGATAVSEGPFRNPDGIVGRFVTVWERQKDLTYRWVYDGGAPDDPQPAPRTPPEEGDIVVTALDAIQGMVADCPKRGEAIPPAPAVQPDASRHSATMSSDGTLQWRWEHDAQGNRRFVAYYFHDGQWELALDRVMPSAASK